MYSEWAITSIFAYLTPTQLFLSYMTWLAYALNYFNNWMVFDVENIDIYLVLHIHLHIRLALDHFWATGPFDTHSDSYSTNLVLVHSLCWMGKILIFTPFNSTTLTNIIWLVYSSTVFYSVPRIFLKVYDSEKKCHLK